MKTKKHEKLIIIGAGPAGLSAGIYSARAGLEPLIIENGVVGGQMTGSDRVENYPGVPETGGAELAALMKGQALKQGARLSEYDPFISASLSDAEKRIETEDAVYSADAVIIAAGASPVLLPLEGEERLRGRGIHYCALCDGAAYAGRDAAVIGGGSSALEDALYLAEICRSVTIIRRRGSFRAEKRLVDKVMSHPAVRVLFDTELVGIGGETSLEYLDIMKEGKRGRLNIPALFCRIGLRPQSAPFADLVETRDGYIPTDLHMRTNVAGVFAAGDIREKECRQIVTAVSDGAIAALSAEKFLADMGMRGAAPTN